MDQHTPTWKDCTRGHGPKGSLVVCDESFERICARMEVAKPILSTATNFCDLSIVLKKNVEEILSLLSTQCNQKVEIALCLSLKVIFIAIKCIL